MTKTKEPKVWSSRLVGVDLFFSLSFFSAFHFLSFLLSFPFSFIVQFYQLKTPEHKGQRGSLAVMPLGYFNFTKSIFRNTIEVTDAKGNTFPVPIDTVSGAV